VADGGYGLGLMMDIASPLGSAFGHSGQGPDSVARPITFRSRRAADGSRRSRRPTTRASPSAPCSTEAARLR